jgi:Skp family chaperone for outer membrane proteins
MKFFQSIGFIAVLLFFSMMAGAQTGTKIGLINSYVFADEKAGITKYLAANKTLIDGFKPLENELNGMNTRLQTLSKEIEDQRKLPAADPKAIEAKIEAAEKLQRDIKFKTEDAKAQYVRREQQVLGPITQAIGSALQDYAKQKGYVLIFDIAKDQNGLLIAIGDQSVDVTKDFIAFYNAKP